MSVLFRTATMTMAWAMERRQMRQRQIHVLSVCFRTNSLTKPPTFITAITAAAVAAIALVLAMAAHGDEREREQSLMHHCVTNASTSTPQAFHSKTNLFALISLSDHVPCFRSQNTTKKNIDVPVQYADAFHHLTQEACGHQLKITTTVSGNAFKVLKWCLICHPMERKTCRAEEGHAPTQNCRIGNKRGTSECYLKRSNPLTATHLCQTLRNHTRGRINSKLSKRG
jgi:hypothetical protein